MKITTVIPAYKPKYLRELLIALQYQTVKPERVIFSDDSPDRAFHAALTSEPLKSATAGLDIEMIDGPRAGPFANCCHLLKIWNGSTPLVHLLLDDDVIYPEFYQRHIAVHATGTVDCSISRRWTALESGQPVAQLPIPNEIAGHPHRALSLATDFVFATTIPACNNWLGEVSNAVFNREVSGIFDDPRLCDISFEGLGDIGFFLSASLRKPLGFLNDSLGYFRLNPAQSSQQSSSHNFKLGHVAWIALGLAARRLHKVQPEQAARCFRSIGSVIAQRYAGVSDMLAFCELIPGLASADRVAEDNFVELWHAFIQAR